MQQAVAKMAGPSTTAELFTLRGHHIYKRIWTERCRIFALTCSPSSILFRLLSLPGSPFEVRCVSLDVGRVVGWLKIPM